WLMKNQEDAEDAVHDSFIKALRHLDGLHGDARPWILTIVRNTCYTLLKRRVRAQRDEEFDEEVHGAEEARDPEALTIRRAGAGRLKRALAELPVAFREVIVLREIEGMSYREIGDVTGVPIGTVMSRLSRGRSRLMQLVAREEKGD